MPAAAVDLTGSIGHGPVWRSTTNDNWEGRGLPELSSSGIHGACGRRVESRVGRPLTSCLRASRHTWKETPVTSGGAGSQSGRPGSAHMQMPGNPTDVSIPTPSIGRAAAGHGPSPDTRMHEGGALALRLAAMPRSIPPRPAPPDPAPGRSPVRRRCQSATINRRLAATMLRLPRRLIRTSTAPDSSWCRLPAVAHGCRGELPALPRWGSGAANCPGQLHPPAVQGPHARKLIGAGVLLGRYICIEAGETRG